VAEDRHRDDPHADATGVLVMAHGTPAHLDELEAFYTDIRRGRPPTSEQLADLRARYDAIGGTSPLMQRTLAQVAGITRALEYRAPGRYAVAYGTKFAAPRIADGVRVLADKGLRRAVGLVLTPHYSSVSVGDYSRRAREAASELSSAPMAIDTIASWWQNPGFDTLLADRIATVLAAMPPAIADATWVIFTAHSVPAGAVADGDPYSEQVHASAVAVARAAGLERCVTAWQSAGRTPGPWLGPDVLEVIETLPERGARGVVVCPVGFVADHLEVLYDLDIEARRVAERVGLAWGRTPSLDDDPRLCELLARVVIDASSGETVPTGEASAEVLTAKTPSAGTRAGRPS
jgi:protoporphyrin/coproporphyrin ferrochelatase